MEWFKFRRSAASAITVTAFQVVCWADGRDRSLVCYFAADMQDCSVLMQPLRTLVCRTLSIICNKLNELLLAIPLPHCQVHINHIKMLVFTQVTLLALLVFSLLLRLSCSSQVPPALSSLPSLSSLWSPQPFPGLSRRLGLPVIWRQELGRAGFLFTTLWSYFRLNSAFD